MTSILNRTDMDIDIKNKELIKAYLEVRDEDAVYAKDWDAISINESNF